MRITPKLKLVCKECGWRPLESQKMAVVKDHFDQHHDGRTVVLDISTVCDCGKEMRLSHTTSAGNLFQDNFVCDCGNIGFVTRSGNT